MNVFDFVTQEELDEFPDDNNMAFAEFVRIAQRRLAQETNSLEKQKNWEAIHDARYGFMNTVVAAAKRYGIEPFATLSIPRIKNFDSDDHRQFKADLDHYMTQLILDNSLRGKRETVLVEEKEKDRIRRYVYGLRECIENSNLPEAKRKALNKKLDAFEAELGKRRVSLFAVTLVTLEILALPGGIWASAEIPNKLITGIMQTVAEAKAVEDESRKLPPTAAPAALSPPRNEEPRVERKSADLDDDIPF